MTINEFTKLPIEERYLILWSQGSFLAGRLEGNCQFNLYFLFGFFCEVEYNAENNYIGELKTFINNSSLEPYLEFIKLGINNLI